MIRKTFAVFSLVAMTILIILFWYVAATNYGRIEIVHLIGLLGITTAGLWLMSGLVKRVWK